MYSFGNRKDMTVIDEPFYGYYLDIHPEIDHPGRSETLESMPTDYGAIITEIIMISYPTPHVFFKNMAHHLDQGDWSFIKPLKNLFLIRNPRQLIASFAEVIPNPTMLDIGLKLEWEIFEYAQAVSADCLVLDSNEVLKDPKTVLTKMSDQLGIPFSDQMLEWKAGPRPEDGCWAKYWYANVHKSTGWKKQTTSSRPFPERLQPLLDEAMIYYNLLAENAIRV